MLQFNISSYYLGNLYDIEKDLNQKVRQSKSDLVHKTLFQTLKFEMGEGFI